MALRMPGPFQHSSGTFFLNSRVPSDLVGKARSSRVSLPVGDATATVAVTTKVFLSLRTKDPAVARARFADAYGALVRHWAALRAGPKPLTHKQLVALAGDVYRECVVVLENDPAWNPDAYREALADWHDAIDDWRSGCGAGFGGMSDEHARFYAAIQRPSGAYLLALGRRADVDLGHCTVTYQAALEQLFGGRADKVCARRHVVVDAETRARLLREIGEVVHLAGAKLSRNLAGDYSEDQNLKRFPAFEAPAPVPAEPPVDKGRKTMAELHDDWRAHNADKRAASTLRRYAPSLQSLIAHLGVKDVRLVTEDDVWTWAEKRRDVDGIAPRTINRNDLVAVASVLQFATTRPGGRLLATNPARGVKLDLPSRPETRDKTFHLHEVRAILRLARGATGRRYPKAAASRRWAPWICAYTGARIQEVFWLRKEDIWLEGAIWVIRFPRTKEARARTVPVHDALIAEGFIDFWRAAADGPLFTGDMPQKEGVTRTPAEMRASELATWIQQNVALEDGVSPNHGWRHTFLTIAEGVGISKRHANAIAGHNRKKDASDGYVAFPIDVLKREIDKVSAYDV